MTYLYIRSSPLLLILSAFPVLVSIEGSVLITAMLDIQRTTIIVSNLSKEEFLQVPRTIRSELDKLATEIHEPALVEQWSELPFLSRLVISIKSEDLAKQAYQKLRESHPELKVHLSECIIRRNKSFDGTLQAPVSPKLDKYEEPEPAKSDDEDKGFEQTPDFTIPRRRTLVEGLKLNTSFGSGPGQTDAVSMSPTITLEECGFQTTKTTAAT